MNFTNLPYEESQFPTQVWVDGACSGNPGPGGAAALIQYSNGKKEEISIHEPNTTNQRMEISAVNIALERIKNNKKELSTKYISILSDSAYVCNCINQKWYINWIKNGWKNSKKDPVANRDLWEILINFIQDFEKDSYSIDFVKVKAHNGNTYNERVDELAVLASRGDIK